MTCTVFPEHALLKSRGALLRTEIPITDNYFEFIGYRTRLQSNKYKNLVIPESNYQPLLKECKTLEEFATIFYLRKHDPNKLEQIFTIHFQFHFPL